MSTLGKNTLGRTLGSGVSCKVKVAKAQGCHKVAIKILKDDKELKDLIDTEVQVLRKLHHDNIVNFIEMGSDTLYRDQKKNKVVNYIVLELA